MRLGYQPWLLFQNDFTNLHGMEHQRLVVELAEKTSHLRIFVENV